MLPLGFDAGIEHLRQQLGTFPMAPKDEKKFREMLPPTGLDEPSTHLFLKAGVPVAQTSVHCPYSLVSSLRWALAELPGGSLSMEKWCSHCLADKDTKRR